MALREGEIPGDSGKMSGFQRWRKRIDEKKPEHRGFAGLSRHCDVVLRWCVLDIISLSYFFMAITTHYNHGDVLRKHLIQGLQFES